MNMKRIWTSSLLGGLALMAMTGRAEWMNQTTSDTLGNHLVDGITGPTFSLVAKEGHVSTAEGGNVYSWLLANGAVNGGAQYPAPTLIVNQSDTVIINLANNLPFPVSLVFPGQGAVTASGGTAGLLTREAPAMVGGTPGTVTYSFKTSFKFFQ